MLIHISSEELNQSISKLVIARDGLPDRSVMQPINHGMVLAFVLSPNMGLGVCYISSCGSVHTSYIGARGQVHPDDPVICSRLES